MTARHLAITMGDPAGIGPEIIVRAASGSGPHPLGRPEAPRHRQQPGAGGGARAV